MMEDRIRIYELAKRMNVPNQDVITALRELGYDVKSHSSTIDAAAVNLLIAKQSKKKEKKAKTKADKELSQIKPSQPAKAAAQTKIVEKAPAKVIPPQAPPPPLVKPRVLSRYRKVPSAVEGTLELVEQTVITPIVPVEAVSPAITEQPIPAIPISVSETQPLNTVHKEVIAESITNPLKPVLSPEIIPAETKEKEPEEKKEEEIIVPEALSAQETKSIFTGASASVNTSESIRPLTPSVPAVPIRIAAPSIRATPPRPPKTHRHGQSPDGRTKKEDKQKSAVTLAATAATLTEQLPKSINLPKPVTVQELADRMAVPLQEVIKRLLIKGIVRTVNQLVELEIAFELANEMGYEISTTEAPTLQEQAESELVEVELSEGEQAKLIQRPPVVTIMGHVDHGKTSLLDAIRQTKFLLTDSEAGGITQHIGAYHVEIPHEDGTMRQIVFLDTPGHEAFTAMRARGAKATDIAILVVAADDGVMPQTIEAIDHAKAAGVPIIVAVNKIDKPGADPNRVLSQLMQHELVPEQLGGQTVTVNVSAKQKTGLDDLLEMILLVAELQDLKANPDKPASGVIIEAELSRGKGAVATALVESGTLREGDFIVVGSKSGKVRALFDDRGQRVKAAGPSMPVEVLGLDEVPQAGDRFEVVDDNQSLRLLVEKRKETENLNRGYHVTLESFHDMLTKGEIKELDVIIKADVQGTAEAIADSVRRLTSSEVQVRVLRTASGDISENDVNLAASSNAIIIGFNVQLDHNASRVSEASGVDIRTYSVIYQITDDLQKAIEGLIEPVRTEVLVGTAEVRQIFKFGKNLMIAGCMVVSGKVIRSGIARIERDSEIIYEGKIETLKRFKDDAREVAQGFECGMSFEKFSDIQEGDKINVFVVQETKRGT
jgi:translation initiation factor IF-2